MDTLHVETNHSLDDEQVSSYFNTVKPPKNSSRLYDADDNRRSVHRDTCVPGQSLNLGCYMRLLLYNPIHYSTWPIINPQRDVKKKKIPCLTKKALMGPVILLMETENTSSGQVWLRQQADKSSRIKYFNSLGKSTGSGSHLAAGLKVKVLQSCLTLWDGPWNSQAKILGG